MQSRSRARLGGLAVAIAWISSGCAGPVGTGDSGTETDAMAIGRDANADGASARDAAAAIEDVASGADVTEPDVVAVMDSGAAVMDAGLGAMDAGAARDAGAVRDAGTVRDGAASADAGAFRSSTRQTARMLGYRMAPSGFYEYLPPGYDGATPAPLLVFWHGVGENGNGTTELTRVLANGPPRLIARDQWPATRPFVVLSAQHPGSGCPTATEIRAFIAWAMTNYAVDSTRIYLTGLSCGAIGSWNYLGANVDMQVVAAVLIAGDGRGAWGNQRCNLGRVAIWGFHGESDTTVAPDGTRVAMNNLIACPMPPRKDARLTMYPGVGHDSWSRTYDLSAGHDIYAWLLSQRR